jgi:hypothetical protein
MTLLRRHSQRKTKDDDSSQFGVFTLHCSLLQIDFVFSPVVRTNVRVQKHQLSFKPWLELAAYFCDAELDHD